MTDLHLVDEWLPDLLDLFAVVNDLGKFTPSAVSIREQRAREQADRTIKAFSERFTEKGFFPEDDVQLVFALLPQLDEWPADVALRLINEQREVIATWTKGSDGSVIKRHVNLERMNNGDYAALGDVPQSVNDLETLFQLILPLLPAGSGLGTGGNFAGSETTAGRIVTLREQIAALVKSERAQVFDALLADDAEIKSGSDDRHPNPFLPFWQQQPTDRSPVLNMLLALHPEISPARFEALLDRFSLSDTQSDAFLEKGELPELFSEALEQSTDEWSKDKGLDGIFHSRTYSPDADVLAQEFGEALLKERFDYELIITEPWQAAYEPSGSDDKAIVLKHDGYGNYGLRDLRNGGTNWFNGGTDSFYRAIGSALQPHERRSLGMQSETDVAGLRTTVGNLAATAKGGWFDPQNSIEVKNELLPKWMKDASTADKLLWNHALEDYRQALVEAQSPDFPDISQYGSAEHLRSYARTELEQRLSAEVGVTINPDDITVVTTESTWTGSQEEPPAFELGFNGRQVGGGEIEHSETRRSLTQLCLENLRIEDSEFWLTAQFLDSNGLPISALTKNYVHGLVRELNVGESYAQFLRQRLLTSDFGQWSRECYAHVMATQMRLDAVEAKMAGDFLPDRADRGYHWVRAVLDHPVDDGNRPLVEGHRIRAQTLTLKYKSPVGPQRSWDAVPLEGVLLIAPESRLSVPGLVIYTPSAPDGVRFREFSSDKEMERGLLGNTNLHDHLVSRAPVGFEVSVREGLINTDTGGLTVTEQSALTTDFYFAHYKNEVEKAIAQVDAQTTSTSEANWSSAWNIASTLGELALEFAPFKVALPIAAARSLYALTQGARALDKGDSNAGVHLTQAVLLLADGLPGVKKAKVKLSPNIDPKWALKTSPADLKLRTDGNFNGVYEHVNNMGHSSFYAKDAGRVFSIRYDSSTGKWGIPEVYRLQPSHQIPIALDRHGRWVPAPNLGGGGRDKVPKVKKSKKGAEGDTSDTASAASVIAAGGTGSKKRYTLDMEGFSDSRAFKNAEKMIEGDVAALVERAVKKYVEEGKGNLHPSAGGLWSLDLPGVRSSSKRGAWRLMLEPPTKENVLKVHSIMDPH
ncbi:MAG: hypothetical protein JWQ69_4196 [Pseudomonas sp.]|nr:hypothetical protein [Pseudomonas sp.]